MAPNSGRAPGVRLLIGRLIQQLAQRRVRRLGVLLRQEHNRAIGGVIPGF